MSTRQPANSQDVADTYALGHALPRMPCDCQVQRITEFHHLTQLLQAVIDAVQKAVVLPPLLSRIFRSDDREDEGNSFSFVLVRNLLHWRLPRHGDFLAGDVLAVGEPTVLDILACQAEDVVALHALGIDREQENVACEDDLPWLAAQIKVAQEFNLVERQSVPVFLDVVAHVQAFKRVDVGGKTVIYGKFINTLQITNIKGNGVAPQLLVLQPRVVVAHQQGIEVLERHFVLA